VIERAGDFETVEVHESNAASASAAGRATRQPKGWYIRMRRQ